MTRSFEFRPAKTTPESLPHDQKLQVVVIFTTEPATLVALKAAARLTAGLSAQIRVVVACIVPYPLPLGEPAVFYDVRSRRLSELAQQAGVDCTIEIRLCREYGAAFKQAIAPRSVVIIGTRPHWWELRQRKLAAQLLQEGHQIAYAE